MGLRQGSRATPPSWIQLSSVIVNVLQGLECGAMLANPITVAVIHAVGSMFVYDIDLYFWEESLKKGGELFEKSKRKQILGEIS